MRTYLEGKAKLNLKSLSKILRSHFKEPNATTLFNELSTAKQLPSESAQEFVVRLMSLHQKIIFISNEDNCSYSEALVQEQFLHAILVGLRNDNIRNKLRPFLKNSIVSDEDILENLLLAMSDEQEHFANFGKKRVEINSVESVDNPKPNPPSNKQTINPIIAEIQTLKTSIDSLSSWKDDFEKRDKQFKSRLSKQRDTLPRRCPNCHQNNVDRCFHCFYCGSSEHLLAGCLKRKRDRKDNQKN